MHNSHNAGDSHQSRAVSLGIHRGYSLARSTSSFFEDVEMAQDEVRR